MAKLEELLPRAAGKVKENIQKEIILTKRRYLQQQERLSTRYVVENLYFERHAVEQMQESNFMAVPVSTRCRYILNIAENSEKSDT